MSNPFGVNMIYKIKLENSRYPDILKPIELRLPPLNITFLLRNGGKSKETIFYDAIKKAN